MTNPTNFAADVPLLIKRLDEARLALALAESRHGAPVDEALTGLETVIQRLQIERERALHADAKIARLVVAL